MAGTKFGAYEILHELKTGGMGAVLLARRRGPGAFEQLVAIKTIRAEFAATASVRAMFLDEAAILARLSSPGIARVYDFGEEAGTLYMVMEYVAGIPFRELAELAPPPQIAARAIAEAGRGLHAAHESRDLQGELLGLVHRDISPDNLMLGFDGHVKVIDFGIALVKNRQAPVTEFGMVKGKPPYMSPEQVKNEAMDRRSDVFSLSVVLHELLAGKSLFDGDSIYAIARAVEHQVIPRPSAARGEELPVGLDAAVMNALDRDVERRTATAAAFATDLEEVLQVAGGESLQAWVERELATKRDAHRAWLAKIVDGDVPTAARPIGRPSGTVTALNDPLAETPIAASALTEDERSREDVPTHLAADTGRGAEPLRRRSRLPIVLALIVVAALGLGIAMLIRGKPHDAVAIAPIDAAAITKLVPIDAAPVIVVVAAPPDAPAPRPSPPDAPSHRTISRDAATPLPPPPADAAIQLAVAADAAPSGSGFINVFPREGGAFLNVMIDNKPAGPTPIMHRKLAAGSHVIQLLAADTSAVVLEKSVAIEDGKTVTVRQP